MNNQLLRVLLRLFKISVNYLPWPAVRRWLHFLFSIPRKNHGWNRRRSKSTCSEDWSQLNGLLSPGTVCTATDGRSWAQAPAEGATSIQIVSCWNWDSIFNEYKEESCVCIVFYKNVFLICSSWNMLGNWMS